MLFSLFSSFHSLPLKIVDVDINIAWAAVRSCDYHLWLRPPDRVYQCLDTSPDSGLTTQIWETSESQQNRKYHATALSSPDHFLNQSAFRKLDINQ